MVLAGQTGRQLGMLFSTCPFVCSYVRLFICYQICQHCILKTNKTILMALGTSSPCARVWNGQLWGSGGQKSRSHDMEI